MKIGNHEHLTNLAKELFKEERSLKKLDGWFRIKEFRRETDEQFADLPAVEKAGQQLKIIAERLPISISRYAVFAGTQRDAFARSYALINLSSELINTALLLIITSLSISNAPLSGG